MTELTHISPNRKTIRDQLLRHPMATFIILAYGITWLMWLVMYRINLGAVNAFGVVSSIGPALAAMIVSAYIQPELSSGLCAKRWALLTIIGLPILGIFALRRLWLQAGLVTVAGRVLRPVAYPSLGAFLMDILAAAMLAFFLSGIRSPRRGVRDLLRSLDPHCQTIRWYWFVGAAGLYPAIVALGNVISSSVGLPKPAPQAIGVWYWLVLDALLMFLYVLVGGGGLEEPGWRGFALPLLLKRYSLLRSSLILAVIWAFWHWPLFWFGIWEGGPLGMFFFAFGAVPLTVLLTAVFNRSGGSLPVVILLHTTFNITSSYVPPSTLATSLWMLLILVIALWMWRAPETFSFRDAENKLQGGKA